jgi:hypothetical protein
MMLEEGDPDWSASEEAAKKYDEEERLALEKKESEENKPECKICFEQIEYKDIVPMECNHIYHTVCLSQMITINITSKSFPITCPDDGCNHELSQAEVSQFVAEEMFTKFIDFGFKDFMEKNN